MTFTHANRLAIPALCLMLAAAAQAGKQAPVAAPAADSPALAATPEGQALHAAWTRAGRRFTPEVKSAYLALAKAQAKRDLAAAGANIPAHFLAWVDSNPVVEATVYGSRHSPARILTILRSLELDLGSQEVRQKHTQLALAMAVVNAGGDGGTEADGSLGISLAPRNPPALSIPSCPLKPVDTHPKDRPLDVNDHIVNFFEGRTVGVDVKTGTKVENGKKIPVMEKRPRPMAACDVMADPALQAEFNAYMKAHGQSAEVHCGDHVIHWNSHDMVRGPDAKPILDAYHLFKTAYEAKGLLPARRDPAPTLAETCAFLIRNDATPLAEGVAAKWPKYPLDAPWPTLTFLAQNRQPLRECEDIWRRWHDKGEFHGYGEYIGGIAQQFEFQSARRLKPYDYAYGTLQMMLKDGGVCGTMANLCARSNLALGVPSCTAGQPGHCALVSFAKDAKTGTFSLVGGQFVTGGPDKTTPHAVWSFGDDRGTRPMIYPMATAYAVNHGLQSFLDSNLAWNLWRILPAQDRQTGGMALLQSAAELNPYNFLVAEALQAQAATPAEAVAAWTAFEARLAAQDKPGCPKDGLYSRTVRARLYGRLAALPLPADAEGTQAVAAFLDREKCENAQVWFKYQAALLGLPAVRRQVAADLQAAVAGDRTVEGCATLAGRIETVAKSFKDKKERQAWAAGLLPIMAGHEGFVPAGSRKRSKPNQDPCAETLFKLAGQEAGAKAREAARQKAQSDAAKQDLSKPKK